MRKNSFIKTVVIICILIAISSSCWVLAAYASGSNEASIETTLKRGDEFTFEVALSEFSEGAAWGSLELTYDTTRLTLKDGAWIVKDGEQELTALWEFDENTGLGAFVVGELDEPACATDVTIRLTFEVTETAVCGETDISWDVYLYNSDVSNDPLTSFTMSSKSKSVTIVNTDSLTAYRGDEIELEVAVLAMEGDVAWGSVELDYDKDQLELTAGTWVINVDGALYEFDIEQGLGAFMLTAPTAVDSLTLNLKFRVKDTAAYDTTAVNWNIFLSSSLSESDPIESFALNSNGALVTVEKAEEITALRGDTFTVDIVLSDITDGVAWGSVALDYDPAQLTLDKGVWSVETLDGTLYEFDIEQGLGAFVLNEQTALESITLSLTFTVKTDASFGPTAVDWDITLSSSLSANTPTPFTMSSSRAVVTVGHVREVVALRGEEIELEITVSDVRELLAWGKIVLNYDAEQLTLADTATWTLKGAEGDVEALWEFDVDGGVAYGAFMLDEATAVESITLKLTFTVKDTAAYTTTDIRWNVSLYGTHNTDAPVHSFTMNSYGALVTVSQIEHATANRGDEIEFTVTLKDFPTSVAWGSVALSYDTNRLELTKGVWTLMGADGVLEPLCEFDIDTGLGAFMLNELTTLESITLVLTFTVEDDVACGETEAAADVRWAVSLYHTYDSSAPVMAYTRSSCGAKVAVNHTEVTDEAVAPTCTQPGLTEGTHCSFCKEVLVVQDTVPATGIHTDGDDEDYICDTCDKLLCTHDMAEATCTSPATCTRGCGYTEGEPLGHDMAEATCTAPKTCTRGCGYTEGTSNGHKWQSATCTAPKTCTTCKVTEGEPLDHNMAKATCTSPATCTRGCGYTVGDPLGHKSVTDAAVAATCTTLGKTEGSHCSVCNVVLVAQHWTPALGHDLKEEIKDVYNAPNCKEGISF